MSRLVWSSTIRPMTSVGIDFGTSNSALALVTAGGQVEMLDFPLLGARTHSYRSLLYFDRDEQEVGEPIAYAAGVEGIEAYLDNLGEGRLIQSFKTHLTSASLGRTQIGCHTASLDDMLGLFFSRLRAHLSRPAERVTVGRPVRFAGAAPDDEATHARAQRRIGEAARQAGFAQVAFELEPIAAAFHYEQQLTHPELALIADFGAGTTDYCLMQLGPNRTGDRREDIVVTHGVGVAGDDLDAAIIREVVWPQLGWGGHYVDMGRRRPIPRSYYNKLSHWHQLSFLRDRRTQQELTRLQRLAEHPEGLEALMHIVEHNQGFHLHKAVERLKVALSTHDTARFEYADGPVTITAAVARADFERWIAPHVDAMVAALDETLERAAAAPTDVDRVFLTGGTAFVPAVRREFARRFGAAKLSGGDELLSIASGLALHAARR